MVRLAITDQGQGLTPAQQAGLFQRFERVAGSGASGIGLGLTLVDEVARRHGGSVTVDSTPGAGATFTLSLPLARDADV
jgi:signal transduction histidine kinase